MWWYIAFGIVFSVYALDLLFLFLASLFAAVVEYFVPPISTAATRAAARRQRVAAAKQQRSKLGGKRGAAAANGKEKDGHAIVVDARDSVKAQAVPGADRYPHLTDLYRGEFPKVRGRGPRGRMGGLGLLSLSE
jgi:hypothetical protein